MAKIVKKTSTKFEDILDRFIIIRPILQKISQGSFFNTLFYWILTIAGILTFLTIIGISIKLWSSVGGHAGAEIIIGMIILQVMMLLISFFVANIMLVRAGDIKSLKITGEYFVTPIFVIIIKMTGEVLALLYSSLSVTMAIVMFAGGDKIRRVLSGISLPGLGANSPFIIIIQGIVIGLLILISIYFAAEQLGAIVEIARNTKKTTSSK